MDKKVKRIIKTYLSGRLKCAEFALTNTCIAKCTFCGIWKQKPKVFVDRETALATIDKLAEIGTSHICFTGGEPLMHPDIALFVERAAKHSINNVVLDAAPGLLLQNDIVKRLESAGCDMISISYDSSDAATMEKSRSIPNILQDMQKALDIIGKSSLKAMASVLIWKGNFDCLEPLIVSAQDMGFDLVSLNYPTFSDSPVYELGGEGIAMSREDVISALESAVLLAKSKKYRLLNNATSMNNIISYLKDPKTAKYQCFGGSRVLFVDWFFDVYPCMQLPKPIGKILELSEKDFNMPACNACNMSWYRDFSVYFHGPRSLGPVIESLAGAKGLF
nr:radical SAM domain protein [uncultured bacterium]